MIHVPDCPNVATASDRILEAARRTGVSVDLRMREVADEAEAAASGMQGSPTVLIDGTDVVPGAVTASVSCRLYLGSGGAPAVDAIATALRRAREGAAGADTR